MRKLTLSLFALLVVSMQSAFAQEPRPTIQASDVVYMYSANAETYDAFGGTIVGWAGRPKTHGEADVANFAKRVAAAHDRGMKYCGSVDFLVDFAGYIEFNPDQFMDAACVDLDGEPLRVPWLWDHKHKGHPAYWFCSNNPDYQTYLLDQAARASSASIDGLHIDDYSGTSACSAYNGGCFCPHCMDGFRAYMKANFSVDELSKKGVSSIDEFHYGTFLKQHGVTAETYRSKHHSCPLIQEFQTFQNQRMKKAITMVYERAEKRRGKPLLRSINSNASSPRTLVPAKIIDYFCGEVHHHASEGAGAADPVFTYKIVESLGRRQTATASGQDWAWIKANEKPGLVQTWIAQAYAFGSVFMVPHNQWCYTQELGTHWWHGKPSDFAFINQFVQTHKNLLDGFKQLSSIMLIYSENNYSQIQNAASALIEANIPFTVRFAGDVDYAAPLHESLLQVYDTAVTGPYPLPDGQDRIFQEWKDKKSVWRPGSTVQDDWKRHVMVEGADNIRVSVRMKSDSGDPLFVAHVLNQNYNQNQDRVEPKDATIKISHGLLMKTMRAIQPTIKNAVIHQPQKESQKRPLLSTDDGRYVSFTINDLGFWALVELRSQ